MDEYNIDEWEPDKSWIAFKRGLIGVVIGIITLIIVGIKYC